MHDGVSVCSTGTATASLTVSVIAAEGDHEAAMLPAAFALPPSSTDRRRYSTAPTQTARRSGKFAAIIAAFGLNAALPEESATQLASRSPSDFSHLLPPVCAVRQPHAFLLAASSIANTTERRVLRAIIHSFLPHLSRCSSATPQAGGYLPVQRPASGVHANKARPPVRRCVRFVLHPSAAESPKTAGERSLLLLACVFRSAR